MPSTIAGLILSFPITVSFRLTSSSSLNLSLPSSLTRGRLPEVGKRGGKIPAIWTLSSSDWPLNGGLTVGSKVLSSFEEGLVIFGGKTDGGLGLVNGGRLEAAASSVEALLTSDVSWSLRTPGIEMDGGTTVGRLIVLGRTISFLETKDSKVFIRLCLV